WDLDAPCDAQSPHGMSRALATGYHVEIGDSGAQQSRTDRNIAGKRKRLRVVCELERRTAGDGETQAVTTQHGERAIGLRKNGERSIAIDARHTDAPVEVVKRGACRTDGYFRGFASTVPPRHAMVFI